MKFTFRREEPNVKAKITLTIKPGNCGYWYVFRRKGAQPEIFGPTSGAQELVRIMQEDGFVPQDIPGIVLTMLANPPARKDKPRCNQYCLFIGLSGQSCEFMGVDIAPDKDPCWLFV